jgi:predicted AlkP superfamily pyrophosphatase or phosphodiesterase
MILTALLGALATGSASTPAPVAPPRPKLVIVFTVDQLRPDYLVRWKSQLTGGFATLTGDGAVFANAFEDHAVTETAPGHSTILSGRWPAHTGIIRNSEGVQDSTAPLIGASGGGASPRRFRGTALFDWLKAADTLSRALSVSLKDRGAILPLGAARAGAQAYWFSFAAGHFITSKYYADSLPAWVQAFNAHDTGPPPVWKLLLADSAYAELDDQPWENGGQSRTFPHPYPTTCAAAPSVRCGASPFLDSLTLELAWSGLQALKLGGRGHTDLLAVSLSATDYVGHAFGPDSREIHDQVLRLDRSLQWFLQRVFDKVGRQNVVVVLTADHAVTPFPEFSRQHGHPEAQWVSIDTLVAAANAQLTRLGGEDTTRQWLSFDTGMLFLQDNGRLAASGVNLDSLIGALAARLRAVAGVARVDRPGDLARADTAADPVARRWLHHVTGDPRVVLVVSLSPFDAWSYGAVNLAAHGQPTDLDAHVPIILWGRGVVRGSYDKRANTVDIAPTLARLLGVTPFSVLDGRVLTEALAPER